MKGRLLIVKIKEDVVGRLELLELDQWRLTFNYPSEKDALSFTGTKLFLDLSQAKQFLDHYYGAGQWSLGIEE